MNGHSSRQAPKSRLAATAARRAALVLGLALSTFLHAARAHAQFGSQPMRIVFPFAAGGVGDVVARAIAERLAAETGQPALVENRTGASGMLGVQAVKTAPPDGSMLLLTPFTLMVIYPHIYPSLKYDPVKDFTPISQVTSFGFALAVAKNVPARTVEEFIRWARANPRSTSYGTTGPGTLPHFFGVALARAAGIELQHVPYRGSSAALADFVGGQIPIAILPTADLLQSHTVGHIRIIASLDATRSPFVPDVPNLKEAGYDLSGNGWFALYAPAATPTEIVQRINGLVHKLGLEATGTTPAELARSQQAEAATWEPIVKASGFRMND